MVDLAAHFTEFILSVISLIAIMIGFVGWFIRLESKVMYLEKDHEESKINGNEKIESMWKKMDAVQATLNQVLQGIARLEGQMKK